MASEPTVLPVEEASYGGQRVRLMKHDDQWWIIQPRPGQRTPLGQEAVLGPFDERELAVEVAACHFSWGPTFP
jgi:hypothetical protein